MKNIGQSKNKLKYYLIARNKHIKYRKIFGRVNKDGEFR